MTRGCYTCRRRRVVCDNGLPTCRKCRDAGKECLGYQKPLVWVKGGVASRGKMMGLRFEDVMENPKDGSGDRQPGIGSSKASRCQQGSIPASTEDSSSAQDHSSSTEPRTIGNVDGSMSSDDAVQLQSGAVAAPQIADGNQDRSIVHVQAHIPESSYTPSPWGLVDPLFQDLDWLSRLYISHFNQQCLRDLALYDNVRNPYRDLIPFINDSPVIADALAAIGAVHYASIANGNTPPIPLASNQPTMSDTSLSFNNAEGMVTTPVPRQAASKAYEHFLRFKQRALRQLSMDLQDPVTRNDDRTVAGILVFILLDAMESGSGAWKYHLEGAKNLLKSRQSAANDASVRRVIDGLDTFVINSCLIAEIMGSTLARPGALSKPFYSHAMGPATLKRLEETSWVGCPAYLLEVIFFVHAQRYSDTDLYAESPSTLLFSTSSTFPSPEPSCHPDSPASLLQHIQAFDPVAWAEEMQTFLFLPDMSGRIALASAYKAAVYIYASRVLSKLKLKPNDDSGVSHPQRRRGRTTYGRAADHDAVVDELIYQLSLINPTDQQHFKCLVWPTFIAGAESRYAAQRTFALQRLGALWNAISSVNVRNAAWVLELMWRKQDERKVERERRRAAAAAAGVGFGVDDVDDDDEDDEFDWIQELDRSRTDWLFI